MSHSAAASDLVYGSPDGVATHPVATGRYAKFKTDMHRRVSSRFDLAGRDTDVVTEVRAGTATFLTMAYILLVNPQVLGTY
jgi:hypothetical protein